MMKRLMVLFLISVTFIITVVAQKEGLTATPTRIADSSEALFSTKGLSPSSAFLIYDLMFGKMSDKEIKEKYHFVEVNGTVEIPAVVWIEGEDVIPELANYGVRVKHKYGNLLTVQIPLNRFMELAQSNLCKNINVGEEVHPNLDKALAATGVNDIYNGIGLSHGLDGTGVVVGILDVGFEYGHPAFYDSTGTTLRIKRVWDQNAPAVTPPSEFNYYYGNELTTPNEILAAQHSTDGTWELHGTHVAGIAAGCGGNDTIGKTYRGVAPNADIVLVAYRENITCIFEGIDYIKSYAASINKPCVINMSFGSHIGPHDGTSDLCVLFDSTVASSPGVMLVQAAGNEGNKNIHISKTFSSTDSILRTLVAFDEPASGRGKIDVWGNPNESFEVGLFLYNSASHTIDTSSAFYSSTSGFYTFDFTEGNSEVSTTAHISCKDDNRNGRQNIYIELYNTNRLSNNQHIGIEIRCTSNNTVHAWTQGDNSTFINGGYSLATAGDVDYTISDQGTCHSVITVGSYFARNTSRFGQLSNFSSHGPTLDERTKPDITAPGESITAPFNRFAVQGQGGDNIIFQLLVTAITSFQNHTEYYGTLSGTSMATPFVAGVLALCLQENPHLTYSQAIDLLHNKAITDEHTGNISSAGNDLWGWGKVNAMGILDQIQATAPPYTEDFEGETVLWRLANGSNTNRWVIGSATNHTSGGEKALYISDDNGITNTYTNTAASSVIAYCPLILEARDYAISFDWKSYGEGYYDFLRAALVPASVDINLDDWEPTTLPNSYIAIDGGSQLVIHVTWKTQVSTVTIPTAGEYNLVFFWHNNHIGGTNPGAAVDNIIIDTIASNINMPTVLTSSVSGITQSTASCGGNVTSDGGSTITERGVCWSTSQNPTIADAHTSDGAGTGTFTSSITGLTAGTTYYVRAYATNSSGTAYGVILTFTTDTSSSLADGQSCSGTPTITDHEGNVYATVQIGSQCWMRDNLRTTTSPTTGTYLIPAPGTGYTYTGKQARWYNNDSTTYAPQNYGLLYNWNAAADTFNTDFGETSVNTASNNAVSVTFNGPRRGVCPAGWHLPSDAEWTQLTDYVGGQSAYTCGGNTSYIAKALASGTGWNTNTNTCTVGNTPSSNNATGFSAVPAGGCVGSSFSDAGCSANFWSSSRNSDYRYYAYYRDLFYLNAHVLRNYLSKYTGFSVRCLRDGSGYATHAPTVTTGNVSSLTATSATLNGSIANPDSVPITAQGFEWKAADDSSYTQVSATGSTMSYTLTGLTPATNYTYRAFVTTGFGTTYGSEVSFTTSSNSGTDGQPCPGTPTVTDIDGNVYNTVKIGNQCWMKENLRTTRYADSTAIEAGSSNSTTTPYRYTPYNYANNVAVYGYFYNWAAIMHKTASSNTNPSNVQGICPNGWHVPSNAEWMQLTDYVSSQSEYVCGNNSTRIAKALATNTGWRYYATPGGCQIGNNQSTNNATGFSAFPVDYYDDGSYGNSGYGAYFWSTSSYDEVSAYSLSLYHTTDFTELVSVSRSYGLSVRCVRGETSATLPTVITSAVSNITENTATCGGYVSTDGGSEVIEHGICWGSSTNPTVTSNHVAAGTGIGSFNVNISGLSTNTRYYVRAYAINIEGTAYGEEVTFTATSTSNGQDGQPCPGIPTLTDIDGNTYNTVQIGNQCWMRENLKTTHYADGTAIAEGTSNSIIPYRYNPENRAYNVATYGYLYNWAAVMHGAVSSNTNPSNVQGICPTGWHVPSDAEWTQLTDYVSSQNEYVCGNDNRNIVKALAATSWAYSNGNCLAGNNQSTNNATGFSILPAGSYGYGSYYFGGDAWFWSSTSELHAYYRSISESYAYVWRGSCDQYAGHSVRCVHALIGFTASLPTVTTDTVSGITATTATCSSEVTADGGTTVIERGVCWSTSPNPTVVDAHTTDGTGTGSFTSSITGLMPNTTYHVRAYATNSGGTAYGEILTFTTDTSASLSDGQPCLGTPIVTDIDGNTYNTVQIGNQCWMKENLRTTKYIDNTPIPAGTTSSYDEPYRYTPNNDEAYVVTYGYLYNWLAVMHGATSSSANPSGVQGICPTGWHVPSDAEWTQLTDYVSSRSEYVCNGGIHMIAKALAATTGWEYGSPICAVGNTPSNNNATGFSAFPAGAFSYYHHDFGDNAYFWSTTKYDDYAAYIRSLGCTFAYMNRYNRDIDLGFSVRCLRDENSTVDTSDCFNDCHSGSCGEYGSAMYTAAQQLCHLGIVEGINGALQPDTNITRAQLAKVALYSLYNGSSNVPSPLVSDFFPSIYPDLQVDTAYYYRPAKALLYLEYGDGVSPFDRDRSVFNPSGRIERCLVLKVLLETFNIAPATGGTTAFDDYGPSGYSSSKFWGYAQKAYDLGIVQTTHFRPNDYCTRGEAFLYLYRILTNSSINKPTPVNTEDPATSDFFIPTNLSPKVANAIHGVENGNFNYYEKDFFNIPGYMDLNFGVSYNSYLTEMPDDFYPVKPLGKAWTHTYDMYMNIVTDFYHNNSVLVFHMQNGSLLLYKNVNGTLTSMTEGNYYELTTSGNNQYILKSKDQISYTFERKSTSDGIYYLTQIKDRNNNAIDITYSSGESHYRISSVSTLGRTLNFYYTSGTDLLYYVNDPIDRNVYFYYTDEQLGSLKDAKNQTTYFTYGTSNAEKGLLTEITLPRGNMVFNGYQQRKLVSMRRVNNSNSYTHTAVSISPNYQNGSSSSTVTTNLNGSQSITTNYTMNGDNRITNVNDGLHNDMSYEYNISGKPDLVSKASDNKTSVQTTFSYNNKGLPTTVSVSAGGTTRTTNITYTSLNDVYQYTDAKGNTTTYNYTNGNLTSVVDALGKTTTIVNNSQGKPTQVTDPSGVVTNFTYNSYGNETRQSIPSINTYFDRTYDGVSRMTSAKTSCDCQTTSYTYDNNDNMVTETDALNHTTNYTYDANDNVTKITDAKGNATNLTYDDNDFLTSVSAQGASRSYTYNRDGSVATFTNPNGNTFNFSYNSSGELLNDGYASYDYNNKGQLISVTKDNKAITFSYDAFGRISSTAYNNKTISYTYDNNDNILTMTYPGNKTVTYTYDALNRLTSVKDWNNATTTYNYRDDGQLSYYQYPNGVRTTYGYDSGGRAVSQTTKRSNGSGTVVASYNYTWDEFGNHTQETFTEPYTEYPSIPNATTNYSYNNANRLTAAGNLTFGYDNNGNTTSRTGRTYGYDTKNNLTSVSGDFSASYSYDGLGNRRSATRNGVTRQYVLDLLGDMSNVLMETDGSGNTLYYYVYGANGLVSRIDANNNTRYYVYDYRGSTVAMTDATNAATVTHKYQYDDFGKVLQSEEADANPFRYVGQLGVMYEDNALTFMRARYYDPEIGRFLSVL